MSATNKIDYDDIVTIVRTWPPNQRAALVRDVLATLDLFEQPRQRTLAQARGILTPSTMPKDDNIQELLDERRRERYGI